MAPNNYGPSESKTRTQTLIVSSCICLFTIILIITIIVLSLIGATSSIPTTPTVVPTLKPVGSLQGQNRSGINTKRIRLSAVQKQLRDRTLSWQVNYNTANYEKEAEFRHNYTATADAEISRAVNLVQIASNRLNQMDGYLPPLDVEQHQRYHQDTRIHIPNQFDARTHWPGCPQIRRVYDQAGCGSCWAVATVSTITDRTCIATNSTFQEYLSGNELVFCCPECGQCYGGRTELAMTYWKTMGLVTEKCSPYAFPPTCGSPCKLQTYGPSIEKVVSGYKDWGKRKGQQCPALNCEDKHYAKRIYKLENDNDNLKLELMDRGPFASTFAVYEDFFYYKSGIYSYTAGQYVYRHVVKVIGWGQDRKSNLNYWIISNSWGKNWGENGFGRIAMIEESNKDTVSRTVNLMEKPVAGIVQN